MKLFKRNKKESCCEKPLHITQGKLVKSEARIKILGSGCKKCETLEKNTQLALDELNIDLPIVHITDFGEIASYGVMSTPAIVVDEKVISYGKVLSKKELVEKLTFLQGDK